MVTRRCHKYWRKSDITVERHQSSCSRDVHIPETGPDLEPGTFTPNREAEVAVYSDELGAWATLGVAVVGGGIVYELFWSGRSKETESIRKALEQWHGPGMREGRKLVATTPTGDELMTAVLHARDSSSDSYYVYQRHLDFFEALGVAHRKSGRGLSALEGMLGNTVLDEWARWEDVIPAVWGDSAYTYPNFARLVTNLNRFRRRAEAWAAMRRVLRFLVTSDYGRYPI